MTSTNRQELRDFTFSTNSQIGLEVEAMDEKVRCGLLQYADNIVQSVM
jgi:hypothetical protein